MTPFVKVGVNAIFRHAIRDVGVDIPVGYPLYTLIDMVYELGEDVEKSIDWWRMLAEGKPEKSNKKADSDYSSLSETERKLMMAQAEEALTDVRGGVE